jgi:hypothetical protein
MSDLHYIEDDAETFNIRLYNPKEGDLYTILGISEDRANEMENIIKDAYNSELLFSETIAHAISQMKHINEVVFASMLLSRVHDKSKDQGMDKELEAKLRALKLMSELIKSSK